MVNVRIRTAIMELTVFSNNMEQTHCDHCGASLKKFWHRLSPGLVRSLIKFRRAIHEHNRNSLHLYNDLKSENELTVAEQMNWTKLRFHGLVAKAPEEKHWLLTHRGAQFLNGEIQIPKRVQTFRNHVIAKDEAMVTVKDVIGEMPYFDQKSDMVFDYADETDMENVKIHRAKKNKIKNPCPKCGEHMKIIFKYEGDSRGNTVKLTDKKLQCPKCGTIDFIL